MSDLDQTNESGMWYVQFSADVVRAMTLEQLDAAFQSGVIGENTLVREDGTTEWSRLAQIAGIEASEPDHTPSAASYGVTSSELGPQSIRPVVSELHDLDLDEPVELRPRRRGAMVLAIAALMLLGGVGFAATKYSGASAKAASPVAAAQPPASPVAALPSNLTAAISGAHLGDQSIPQASKLTAAQKQAVLDADKKREKQLEEKRSRTPHPKKRAPGGSVFHTGGNVHDPLNSSIGSSAK